MNDPTEDDLILTAYLDGELSQDDRKALSARLTRETGLRERLEELQQGGALLQSAMSAALHMGPREEMSLRIGSQTIGSRAKAIPRIWMRAAAIATIAFLAGAAAARLFAHSDAPAREGWRESVAEYMSLYTAASFPPRDEATLKSELITLSQSVGVELSAPNLRYGSFSPRSGVLLQFEGAPLAQVGYIADGVPAAFCIVRNGEVDAEPTRARIGKFNLISWAKAGRGFMVVSAAPVDRLDDLARSVREHTTID